MKFKTQIDMNKPITIGRNPDSVIYVSEDYDIVSNDHAEITQQGVEIVYTDHSSNGTIINGQKIQGRSVNIYRGDKIVLAGVYELKWSEIEPLITPVGRPTVARNIRGDVNSPSDGQQRFSANSRPTDLYANRNASKTQQQPAFVEQPKINEPEPLEYLRRQAKSRHVEQELAKWNWGAFYFGWIWGVFNKVYISLLQLIVLLVSTITVFIGLGVISPVFSLISLGISIWLGLKGSSMAWNNDAYNDFDHFLSSRHAWNVAAAIFFGVTVFLIFISLLLLLM